MVKTKYLLFVIVLLCSCQTSQDADFELFVKEIENELGVVFLQKEKKSNDFFLPIEMLKKDSIDAKEKFGDDINEAFLFKSKDLNEKNQMLFKQLQLFSIEKKSSKIFSIIEILKSEVVDTDKTEEEQLSNIISRLEEMPSYFSKAKEVIKNPNKEKIQLAVERYSTDFFYLKNELPTLIRKPDILKESQIDFSQKNKEAQIALKDFIAFLNSHLFEIRDNN